MQYNFPPASAVHIIHDEFGTSHPLPSLPFPKTENIVRIWIFHNWHWTSAHLQVCFGYHDVDFQMKNAANSLVDGLQDVWQEVTNLVQMSPYQHPGFHHSVSSTCVHHSILQNRPSFVVAFVCAGLLATAGSFYCWSHFQETLRPFCCRERKRYHGMVQLRQ